MCLYKIYVLKNKWKKLNGDTETLIIVVETYHILILYI